jgi:hypothetical protein
MTSFNDFFSPSNGDENLDGMQELDGDYGCQSCPNQVNKAYFNDKSLEIIWYCKDSHRSSIVVG